MKSKVTAFLCKTATDLCGHKDVFLWISLMVVTLSLPSIIMAHLRSYSRSSVAKVLGCFAKTSSVFMIMSGLILPTRFLTHHGTKTGRFNMGHPPYSLDLLPSDFHFVGPLKNYWAVK